MPARLTPKEAQRLGIGEPKRHKMNAKACVYDDIRFPSQRERDKYIDYKNLQRAGAISNLNRQKAYPIVYNGKLICRWYSDFEFDDKQGRHHTVDAKGMKTPLYKLKKKLVEAFYGITIEEV